MCFLVIKHNFQKPVYQQCGIADQEMRPDPFKVAEIYNIFKHVKSRDLLILQGIPAADQEMRPDPFREPVVYGTAVKVCFHDPETVFDLVSFL